MEARPMKRFLPSLVSVLCMALAVTALLSALPADTVLAAADAPLMAPDLAAVLSGAGFAGSALPFLIGDTAPVAKRIATLKTQRAADKARYDAVCQASITGNREFTPEELTEVKALKAKIEATDENISVLEGQAALHRTAAAVEDPDKPKDPARVQIVDKPGMFGFRDMADFASMVRASYAPGGNPDQRYRDMVSHLMQAAPTNFHQEVGTNEGLMVPPAMRTEIWDLVFDEVELLGLVDSEPTTGNTVGVVKDETTPWGSTGVQAYWGAEAAQLRQSKLETSGEQMSLHKLHAYVLATDELLADAPRLKTRLSTKSAQAIAWKIVEAIMNGTGVGQPKGYRHANGPLVTITKEAGQAADTVNAANLLKMLSRLLDPGKGMWLANSDILPQLGTTSIGNQPAWLPNNQPIKDSPWGGVLLGLPLRFTEHAETLGDAGDIQLINPKGYYAAVRTAGVEYAESMHLFFDYGITAFRWTFRMGGQPHLSAAVAKAKGSGTKSHFVQIEARA
jgi:HK97 family phage major capsid protein